MTDEERDDATPAAEEKPAPVPRGAADTKGEADRRGGGRRVGGAARFADGRWHWRSRLGQHGAELLLLRNQLFVRRELRNCSRYFVTFLFGCGVIIALNICVSGHF